MQNIEFLGPLLYNKYQLIFIWEKPLKKDGLQGHEPDFFPYWSVCPCFSSFTLFNSSPICCCHCVVATATPLFQELWLAVRKFLHQHMCISGMMTHITTLLYVCVRASSFRRLQSHFVSSANEQNIKDLFEFHLQEENLICCGLDVFAKF